MIVKKAQAGSVLGYWEEGRISDYFEIKIKRVEVSRRQ